LRDAGNYKCLLSQLDRQRERAAGVGIDRPGHSSFTKADKNRTCTVIEAAGKVCGALVIGSSVYDLLTRRNMQFSVGFEMLGRAPLAISS
jgi:hypothetical protein